MVVDAGTKVVVVVGNVIGDQSQPEIHMHAAHHSIPVLILTLSDNISGIVGYVRHHAGKDKTDVNRVVGSNRCFVEAHHAERYCT